MESRDRFTLFSLEKLPEADKYMFFTIASLIFIKGPSFLLDRKFQIFIICCILYLTVSQEVIITRILYGAGWFWAVIIGIQLIGEKQILKKRQLINLISYSMVLIKIFILAQRLYFV